MIDIVNQFPNLGSLYDYPTDCQNNHSEQAYDVTVIIPIRLGGLAQVAHCEL
jgi:hypothetical protein